MKNRFRKKASALVTTLFVVVVLSTIVMAFMASMSLERKIASSMKNKFQAELAAEAGLSAAVSQIGLAISTNRAFVTGIFTNTPSGYGPVTIIGSTNLSDTNQIMPLVSTAPTNLVNFGLSTWAGLTNIMSEREGTNSADLNFNYAIQNLANTNFYRAPWVFFTTNAVGPVRYSYFVLDEHARVNPTLPENVTSMTNTTDWYAGPEDLILTNTSGPLLTSQQQIFLAENGDLTLSDDSIAFGFTNRDGYENLKHLVTTSANPSFDMAPASFTNITTRAKYNINDLATNAIYGTTSSARATNIANLIHTNIPALGTRDPSIGTTTAGQLVYLRRLSASIVDYISDENAPNTLVNGGEPAGQKLTPLVTAISIRYRRTALSATSTTIESQAFVQVWNPYTRPISTDGKPIQLVLSNRVKVEFGLTLDQLNEYDQTINTATTIQPNEFTVFEFPTISQIFTRVDDGSATPNPRFPSDANDRKGDDTYWPVFEFFYNNQLVNTQRRIGVTYNPVPEPGDQGGLYHANWTFSNTSNRYHSSFITMVSAAANGWRFVGDPRASYLSSYDWDYISAEASYASGTRWKGIQQNVADRWQQFDANWINRDYVRANPSTGTAPTGLTQTPAQVATGFSLSDTNNSISVLRNGSMLSIGELGHIFDPAQAADDLTSPFGKTAPSKYVSGGGRTLRIGQPEYQVATTRSWATNAANTIDRSAIQLLDIFSANPTNSLGYPFAIGRVNPNTAPVEVLAAILAGIRVNSDTGTAAASLANVTNLANTIISNRPYNKFSDFSKFIPMFAAGTNYSPTITTNSGGVTTNLFVMDRMREEAFGKLVQHLTIQSSTYRIVCIGEQLDAAGRSVSRAQSQALVYFERNASGAIIPVIKWKKFL
jgi:Tfp pilus assembly protein PilX